MTTLALELVDSGISLASDRAGNVGELPAYPGFACIEGSRVVTGLRARRDWRRQPRGVHHRFWEQLDTASLEPPWPRTLKHADLVHAQLEEIWTDQGDGIDEVLFAVPGTFEAGQLALLLGIARACGMPVRGLVDSAVAAASQLSDGSRLLYLDLHLHRAVLTEVFMGSEIERGEVEVEEGCGLVEVQELVARRVARLFLRGTRFDPLHDAASEQAVFDRLPEWMQRWSRGQAVLATLEKGAHEVSLEVGSEEILDELAPSLERLVTLVNRRPAAATLFLSSRCAVIPGLVERLRELALHWGGILPPGAPAQGALAIRASIRCQGSELEHVLRLPDPTFSEAGQTASTASARTSRSRPTHLLLGFVAYSIAQQSLELGTTNGEVRIVEGGSGNLQRHCVLRLDGDSVSLEAFDAAPIRLNEKDVQGSVVLRSGDRLRLGESEPELLLISVDPDGST